MVRQGDARRSCVAPLDAQPALELIEVRLGGDQARRHDADRAHDAVLELARVGLDQDLVLAVAQVRQRRRAAWNAGAVTTAGVSRPSEGALTENVTSPVASSALPNERRRISGLSVARYSSLSVTSAKNGSPTRMLRSAEPAMMRLLNPCAVTRQDVRLSGSVKLTEHAHPHPSSRCRRRRHRRI